MDSGTDTPTDGGTDTPTDGGTDNPPDGGTDNPPDGGTDNPPDGGTDNPPDGGPTACDALWRGDRQFGTALSDEGLSLWGDADGNLYTTGYEQGIVGQTNIEPTGDSRAVVARYAPDGTLLWHQVMDTAGTDTAEHVIGSQDTRYVVGRTTGALPGATHGGQFDVFLAELNPQGELVRTLQSGDARPQHPMKVGVDGSGGLVVAGFDDIFVEHRQVMDTENGFVGRFPLLSPSPQWWWRSASVENPDLITGLALNPLGDEIYVSGYKFFNDAESAGGAFVRRLELDGTQRWFTQIARAGTDVDEVRVSPTGELFAAGSTMFPIGGQGQGETDAYIASLDRETGTVRWVSKTGTPQEDTVTALVLAPSGELYVAGDTFGSFPGYVNQGGRDLFVLRFSASGTLLGVWQKGTAANDHAGDLWVDPCNNLFLTGYTEGALIPDSVNAGSRDSFLMKVPMAR